MKPVFFSSLLLLISPFTQASTPIDGWYSSVFGGYAYIPNNIQTVHNTRLYSDVSYKPGFNAGGTIGYKSNPMRYEGELTYFNANMNHFAENKIRQTHVGGYNNGIMGMANVFYDFPGILQSFQPFLGFGIGYAWLNVKLDNLSPASLSTVHITTSAFAYQGLAGVTYNFSENYALNLGYRYLATPHVFDLGHVFQANLANIGVIYRFDNAKYK